MRDEELGPLLEAIWKKNYSVYGRRKLTKAAKRRGLDCGRDQVERLMKRQGIRGASRAKRRFTTHADTTHLRAPDLVKRAFVATRPDAASGSPTSPTARRGVALSTWPSSSTSSHDDSSAGRPVAR